MNAEPNILNNIYTEVVTIKNKVINLEGQLIYYLNNYLIKPQSTFSPHQIPQTTKENAINNYLRKNKITPGKPIETIESYKTVAIELGDNYDLLKEFYDELKSCVSHGNKQFKFKINSDKINKKTQFLNFGKLLLEKYILSKCYFASYDRNCLLCEISDINSHGTFITGIWFEYYMYEKISSFLNKHRIEYEILHSLPVTFSDGKNTELDISLFIDGKFYCIECKSGKSQDKIDDLILRPKQLNIPNENFILIISCMDDSLTYDLTKLCNITVTNKQNFLHKFSNLLGINKENQIKISPKNSFKEELKKFFYSIGNRPHKKYRNNIIETLLKIKDKRENVIINTLLSDIKIESQLNVVVTEILGLLKASGCIVSKDNVITINYSDKYEIEEKCIKYYLSKVLTEFPDFLNSQANIEIFKNVVGINLSDDVNKSNKEFEDIINSFKITYGGN